MMPPTDYAQSPQIDHRYGGYYERGGGDQYPSGGPNFYPPPGGMGVIGDRNRLDSSPMIHKAIITEPMYEGGALSHIETPTGLKNNQHRHEREFHGERRIGGSYGAGLYP